MTTTLLKSQGLFVQFLLVNSYVFMVLELEAAHPLSIKSGNKNDVDAFDWLSLGAIKQSGPSDPGEGHKFTNTQTLIRRD